MKKPPEARAARRFYIEVLLEEVFHFIHPALALRTVLCPTFVGETIELAQQVFLLFREFHRRLNDHGRTGRRHSPNARP